MSKRDMANVVNVERLGDSNDAFNLQHNAQPLSPFVHLWPWLTEPRTEGCLCVSLFNDQMMWKAKARGSCPLDATCFRRA
jgi:hypothetical protein